MDAMVLILVMIIGYAAFMISLIYVCAYVLPRRRLRRILCVDELYRRGGRVTVAGANTYVRPGALIEVGASCVTIHQDGNVIRLTIGWRTPIAVEVNK